MNTRILLLVLGVAALSSCSSVYKSGQTPDDVYYSPARPQTESYVNVRQEKEGSNYQTYEQYQDSYRDDRFLRMSVGNPYYLNAYNTYGGFDWRYNSFYDGFNYGFNSPWNNYFAWNNFYNPYGSSYLSYGSYYGGGYYGGGYYGSGSGGVKYTVTNAPTRPVAFNLNSYTGTGNRPVSRNYSGSNSSGTYNNINQRYNNSNNSNGNRSYYNNNNSNTNSRSTYTPATNSSNNSYTPSRSYTPSSGGGGGSSSGSSGGGGGSVSRPSRGN